MPWKALSIYEGCTIRPQTQTTDSDHRLRPQTQTTDHRSQITDHR